MTIVKKLATVNRLVRHFQAKALAHEGIRSASLFVVYSVSNPHTKALDRSMTLLQSTMKKLSGR